MQTIEINKVEKQLADLLSIAEDVDEVMISQNGKALARLSSIKNLRKKRIPGLNRGTISTSKDFDDPLSDAFWLGKE
ncbi:MAG: type II toxin-antitoxin system prevent-host-death family antitoxin [Pyrinomonadaceae bacterium]